MAAVTLTLARSTLVTPMAVAIAVASLILLVRFRLSPTLLIAAAAVLARFTR
jgi:hypothetical protein